MIISFIIILFIFQLLVLLSYQTFNDLSLRSLIIQETDDVEESARNAKEVNKILSVLRTLLIVLIIINTSLLNIAYLNYLELNEVIIILLSSFTLNVSNNPFVQTTSMDIFFSPSLIP